MLNRLLEMPWKSLQDMSPIEFVNLPFSPSVFILFPFLSLSFLLLFSLKNPLTPMVSLNMRPFPEKADPMSTAAVFFRC